MVEKILPLAGLELGTARLGQWEDDNERLCEMEPRLRLRRFRLEWDSNKRLLDQ